MLHEKNTHKNVISNWLNALPHVKPFLSRLSAALATMSESRTLAWDDSPTLSARHHPPNGLPRWQWQSRETPRLPWTPFRRAIFDRSELNDPDRIEHRNVNEVGDCRPWSYERRASVITPSTSCVSFRLFLASHACQGAHRKLLDFNETIKQKSFQNRKHLQHVPSFWANVLKKKISETIALTCMKFEECKDLPYVHNG